MASTLEYGSSVENTSWQVSGSVFGCRFEQPLPGYGTALFFHEAGEPALSVGEPAQFAGFAKRNQHFATAFAAASAKAEPLGTAKLVKDNPNLSLDANRSNQFCMLC